MANMKAKLGWPEQAVVSEAGAINERSSEGEPVTSQWSAMLYSGSARSGLQPHSASKLGNSSQAQTCAYAHPETPAVLRAMVCKKDALAQIMAAKRAISMPVEVLLLPCDGKKRFVHLLLHEPMSHTEDSDRPKSPNLPPAKRHATLKLSQGRGVIAHGIECAGR